MSIFIAIKDLINTLPTTKTWFMQDGPWNWHQMYGLEASESEAREQCVSDPCRPSPLAQSGEPIRVVLTQPVRVWPLQPAPAVPPPAQRPPADQARRRARHQQPQDPGASSPPAERYSSAADHTASPAQIDESPAVLGPPTPPIKPEAGGQGQLVPPHLTSPLPNGSLRNLWLPVGPCTACPTTVSVRRRHLRRATPARHYLPTQHHHNQALH